MVGSVSVALLRQGGLGLLGRNSLPLLSTVYGPKQNYGQRRTIISKALREPDYKRPAPFPYEKKKYNIWRALLDDVTQRWDENTKIVVIDGPPTGNKDQFAKEVAAELDMLYIPGANHDELFVTKYGFDTRQLNPQLPLMGRCFDVKDFLRNPNHILTSKMQFHMMFIRYNNYQKAINHIFNTGQGVVMHRSIYSDFVFLETLVESGFMTSKARDLYYESRDQGMVEFKRPHLVIYLDIPVDQVLKNVKARGRPEEINSPFYTPEILTRLENNYKQNYLKKISEHSEVLLYDWSEGGDAEAVVEDICRINFDQYTIHDKKLEDWQFRDEWDYKYTRIWFSDREEIMKQWLRIPRLNVPELVISGEDLDRVNKVTLATPGLRFSYGYNKDCGDNIIFKTG